MNIVRRALVNQKRGVKRSVVIAADLLSLTLALLVLAYVTSLNTNTDVFFDPWWQLPVLYALSFVFSFALRLYRSVIRYLAVATGLRIVAAVVMTAFSLLVVGVVTGAPLFSPPRLVNLVLIYLVCIAASRLLARYYLGTGSDIDAERILIYGAGDAGVQAAMALAHDRSRRAVGFIDDKVELTRTEVAGLPVFAGTDLAGTVRKRRADIVLLAMPSISRARKKRVVEALEMLEVRVMTSPGLQEILSGRAQITEFRDIDIGDLLGRDAVEPDHELLASSIRGRSVMVTGAGGSIGSELCRQIVRYQPNVLVLFEINEFALFNIRKELVTLAAQEQAFPRIEAVLGSVLEEVPVAKTMRRHDVDVVFHAAAYKHVPLVEDNVCTGVRNNLLGTRVVADCALRCGVTRFMLISTDKAVRPTNVMGASKRAAELVVQAMSAKASASGQANPCIFSMVRFGNVLGSSGSVVPFFRQQIEKGGPVTVTHPEIIRYFMTIPEAAQLVIQATSMSKGGEVFLLDMGRPIKIVDLATRMIRLAGMSLRSPDNPAGDIEIEFSGLRPGEKLYEELLIGEDATATAHPKIACAIEAAVPEATLSGQIRDLQAALDAEDAAATKAILGKIVCEYAARQGTGPTAAVSVS